MKYLILILLISCKAQDIQQALDANSKKEISGTSILVPSKNFHWNKKFFPITFYISTDRKADTENAISTAIDKWNKALGFKALAFAYGTFDDSVYVRSPENRIFFAPRFSGSDVFANYYNYLSVDDEEIFHTDIVFDPRFTYATDYDLESVMMHQLGHALGEKHVEDKTDPQSVMTSGSEMVWHSELTDGDVARIRARYGVK